MLIAGRCAKRSKDARKAPVACIARKRLKDRRQVLIARRKVDMEKQKKGVRLEHISKIYTDPKQERNSMRCRIPPWISSPEAS